MTDFWHAIRLDGTTYAWAWVVAAGGWALLVAAVAALIYRRRDSDTRSRQQTVLLICGLVFSAVVLAAFAIGTFEGGTAFAADRLGWKDWRKVIPWASLDAASVGFSLFAIRAVMLSRSPRPARRVVYLTASFSAGVQLTQGGSQHHWQAGAFLAFLALIGYKVLDTVVEQLRDAEEDETAYLKSPKFGLRWLTYPTNTLCAWLAWQNFPPSEGTKPTILNAADNLSRVRGDKLARLLSRPRRPRWAAVLPWVYASRITSALTAQTARADEHAQTVQTLRADVDRLTEQAARAEAAHAELTDAAQTVQALRAQAEQMAAQLAEQTLRADTEQAARTAAEQAAESLRARLAAAPASTGTPRQAGGNRGATSANGSASGPARVEAAVGTLDEQIADDLWPTYRKAMEQNGAPMTRYRVEQDGACRSRQAERVLGLLASRWAEQVAVQTGVQVSARSPEQTGAQTERAASDDQEDSPARAV
jgi:hypothetical protein